MSGFNPGDVVRVKSGGPAMTVEQQSETAMTGETMVWCHWFEKTKQHSGTFPPAVLELVGPGSTPTVNLGHSASKRGR